MPKIFELFGFPTEIQTKEAIECRKMAKCPFMGGECDGGGNRYASQIDLGNNPTLKNFFDNRQYVASGVCSIQLKDGESPWIVCPRRLLVLGREKAVNRANQSDTESQILKLLNYPIGTKLGVWSEVKLMIEEVSDVGEKSFHYTFDYVVVPIGKVAPLASPAVCDVLDPGQLSLPVGATNVTTAPQTPASLFTVILAGQEMIGF